MLSAFAALCLAFAAVDLFTFLDPLCAAGTTTSAEAPLLQSAAEFLPPLAAVVVLFAAAALTYRHLMSRHVGPAAAPVAGAAENGRRAVSGLVMFALCVAVGTLEFIVFGRGQAAGGRGGGAGHGAQARALALAALRALPAAATATFFLGMTLIIIAHVRAGGEGGGGAVAGAGDGPIQGLLRVLIKVAAGMAAALVSLMAMALILYGASKLRLAWQLSLSALREEFMQVAIQA